jgi:hypothetical protein
VIRIRVRSNPGYISAGFLCMEEVLAGALVLGNIAKDRLP